MKRFRLFTHFDAVLFSTETCFYETSNDFYRVLVLDVLDGFSKKLLAISESSINKSLDDPYNFQRLFNFKLLLTFKLSLVAKLHFLAKCT